MKIIPQCERTVNAGEVSPGIVDGINETTSVPMTAEEARWTLSEIRKVAKDSRERIKREKETTTASVLRLLLELQQGQGHVALGFADFEACLKSNFRSARQYQRILKAAKFASVVFAGKDLKSADFSERVLRPLTSLPEDEWIDAWAECEKIARDRPLPGKAAKFHRGKVRSTITEEVAARRDPKSDPESKLGRGDGRKSATNLKSLKRNSLPIYEATDVRYDEYNDRVCLHTHIDDQGVVIRATLDQLENARVFTTLAAEALDAAASVASDAPPCPMPEVSPSFEEREVTSSSAPSAKNDAVDSCSQSKDDEDPFDQDEDNGPTGPHVGDTRAGLKVVTVFPDGGLLVMSANGERRFSHSEWEALLHEKSDPLAPLRTLQGRPVTTADEAKRILQQVRLSEYHPMARKVGSVRSFFNYDNPDQGISRLNEIIAEVAA